MKKILLFSALIVFVANLNSQEIVQWRGDNRDGKYNETGLIKKWPESGPKLLWHFNKLGPGHTSVAVSDGIVYTSGTINDQGYLFTFNLKGELLWKKEYGEEWVENWDGVRTTPLIYRDKIYIISGMGKLICINKKDGSQVWAIDVYKEYEGENLLWGITENLIINDDKIFCTVGATKATVIAVNRKTGKLIWNCKIEGEKSAYGSPLIIKQGKKNILVTAGVIAIYGIDVSTGKLLWSYKNANSYGIHPNTPYYKNGNLFCVSGYKEGGVMLKLSEDGNSVSEVWKNNNIESKMGGFVYHNNRLYGSCDFQKKWMCIDWETGKELFSDNFIKHGNIIFNDGMLYCYSIDGKIALVEPKDDRFEIAGSFSVPYGEKQHWAHLVIADKKLFVRHGTSLMAYSLAK